MIVIPRIRIAACRQVLYSGTIAPCSGIGFQKRRTFQWNAGLGQMSTGWCKFRNLCTAFFWSRLHIQWNPRSETLEFRPNPGFNWMCVSSGSHSGMPPLVESQVGLGFYWIGVRSRNIVCCIPELLPERICIQWNQVGFGFHWMGVCSARLHCMCSACSDIHQHPICVFRAELSASPTGSCKYNRTAELSGPKRQSERPRDISAESLKDAAQSR